MIQRNDLGYVAALAAECADGTVLPAVTYGFNGSDTQTCDWGLQEPDNVITPADGDFNYR